MIKRVKDHSYSERLVGLGLNTLSYRRMRVNLIETFKIMEFMIMVDIFKNISLKLEINCHGKFQKLSL